MSPPPRHVPGRAECSTSVSLDHQAPLSAAKLGTKILDFGGLDSSGILILSGGIPRPIGDFPEIQSQGILAGIILGSEIGRILVGSIIALATGPCVATHGLTSPIYCKSGLSIERVRKCRQERHDDT